MDMTNCCSGGDIFDICGPRFGLCEDKLRELIREVRQCDDNSGNVGENIIIDYSYEEQWTGRLWVDGKKIYEKSFRIDDQLKANTQLLIKHNIDKLEQVIKHQAITEESPGYFCPITYIGPDSGSYVSLWFNLTDISLKSYKVLKEGPAYITVQYTCTDR